MRNHTIEEAGHLEGYVEGYLVIKFFHALLLTPQIPQRLVAKVLNWPQPVLSAFLADDSETVRTVSFDDKTVTITRNRQRYIDVFHDKCRRYGLYPKPESKLELSFIDALTWCTLYDMEETDFLSVTRLMNNMLAETMLSGLPCVTKCMKNTISTQ